jgi:hypothetical protein
MLTTFHIRMRMRVLMLMVVYPGMRMRMFTDMLVIMGVHVDFRRREAAAVHFAHVHVRAHVQRSRGLLQHAH